MLDILKNQHQSIYGSEFQSRTQSIDKELDIYDSAIQPYVFISFEPLPWTG